MQVGGALHVLPVPKGDTSAAAAATTTTTTRPPAAAAAAVGEEYAGLEGWQPHWVLLEANTWRKRVGVLQRFVAAARVVILRNRAERRLQRLRALAGACQSWDGGKGTLSTAARQQASRCPAVVQQYAWFMHRRQRLCGWGVRTSVSMP
jgi:hypothetical protein